MRRVEIEFVDPVNQLVIDRMVVDGIIISDEVAPHTITNNLIQCDVDANDDDDEYWAMIAIEDWLYSYGIDYHETKPVID